MEKVESPTHISLIYLYDQSALGDTPIRFTHIREHIHNRLNSAPVFRQKIRRTPADLDYPYWVNDEKFDLDFHIRHLALPKPGDWRQFCILTSRLHSRPLDMSRPLWEVYVIEGLENVEGMAANSFAIYFKVHHCAMDEFTAQELMQSMHALTPRPGQHKSTSQHIAHLPRRSPEPIEMLLRGLFNNSVRSLRLGLQSAVNFRMLTKILTRMWIRAAQNMAEGDPANTAISRFAQPLSSARVFEGGFFPRAVFDNYLRRVPGASLSHAVLAICGEATRRYLERHGEMRDGSLQALLEVNVRNAGAHAMIGNRIAISQIELHTPVTFPVGRLQAIYAANKELQSIENAELTSFRLRSLYENVPSPVLAWAGRLSNRKNSINRAVLSAGSLGLAELKGADKPLYLLGAHLHGFTTISPLYSGCGLMFSASTYADTVGLAFTSDRHMMPDPEVMRDCLDEAMAAVAKLKVGGPPRYVAPAKKKRKARAATSAKKTAAA
jgi:WS/DGAT/MGAT family acyltransferase